jgi:hypothetical protein
MKPTYYPSYEKFKAMSGNGNVVPVYRQLLADALTPVLALKKISAAGHASRLSTGERGGGREDGPLFIYRRETVYGIPLPRQPVGDSQGRQQGDL